MRSTIPNFVVPVSRTEERRVVAAASVSPEFVKLMATAISTSPDLERKTSNPNRVRDLMEYADAYAALADEFEVAARFLRYSIRLARSQAAGEALSAYALAKHLATQPATGELAPYVAEMGRVLGVRARLTNGRLARKKAAAAGAAEKKDGVEPVPTQPPKS